MNDEADECLISALPAESNTRCVLSLLHSALDFVRKTDTVFETVDIQCFLKSGNSETAKVIDALIVLSVIEVVEEKTRKYRRLADKREIEHDVYYNGSVHEKDNEFISGWDPSLFKNKRECFDYIKNKYADINTPVYVIEKVCIGKGWDIIDREEITF